MNPNMLSPARTLSVSARLTFPTGTVAELDGGDILNFTIEEGADSALLPGAVLSSEVTLELANDAGQWNYGGSIRGERPLVGATVALFLCADTDALPCGVFIITSVRAQERSGKICLSGSDSIPQELSLPFQDDLAYPATLESLWQHLVGQTRYVWSGSLPNGSAIVDAPPNWNGASLRRAAGWIAQAAGCFVRVDREGNLQILPCLDGEIHALTPESYMSYTDGCASYGPVEALQVTPAGAEDPLTVSEGDGTGKTLSIQGNPLYQSEAPNLNALISGTLAQLKGLRLHKGEFRWRGDPEVRVGSRVALTDTLSNVSEIIVTRQTLRYCDGFSATCSCEIPEDDDAGILRAITPEGGVNAGALVGTVDGGLLAAESVTANSIAAQSITTEKIAAGAVSTDRLAADAVTAEKIQAGAITAQKLAAGAVDAQSIAALTAHLYQITSSDVSTDQLYAALGHIVELSVQSLTAGQISADRLAAALAEFVSMHATTGDFDLAAIQNLLANALILEEGVANSMMITNLAVTSANILSATLDKLVIRGEDGKYYHVFVGADGVVSTEETTVSAGEIEAGETQDGRQIVASTANVASLNATTIKASQAIIATIFTESLTAGKITAGEALIASATIPTLYVTSLKAIGDSIDISANGSITSVVSSVSQAQSTANAAQSAASNAQSTANAAQSTASNAQTAADDAQSAANAAQTAADSAQTAADGAQTAADNAQTAADNAQSTADVAQDNASFAIPHYGDAPPSAPIPEGKVWIDSGVEPTAMRRWKGLDLAVGRSFEESAESEGAHAVSIDNSDGRVEGIALEAGCVAMQESRKNLFMRVPTKSSSTVSTTTAANGKVTVSGSSGSSIWSIDSYGNATSTEPLLTVDQDTSVTLSGGSANVGIAVQYIAAGGSRGTQYTSGTASKTFTLSAGSSLVRQYLRVAANTTVSGEIVSPQMEFGTAATTYEPYKESLAIAGRSSVEVRACGRNLLESSRINNETQPNTIVEIDGNSVRIAADSRTYGCGRTHVFLPPGNYIIAADIKVTKGTNRIGRRISADGGQTYPAVLAQHTGGNQMTFTVQPGEEWNQFTFFCSFTNAEAGDVTYSNIRLYSGSSADDFEPYHDLGGGMITPSSPLYGLTGAEDVIAVDQIGGVTAHKNSRILLLDGSEVWGVFSTNTSAKKRFRLHPDHLPAIKPPKDNNTSANVICSHYSVVPATTNGTYYGIVGISVHSTEDAIYIFDERYSSGNLTEWKAYLAAQYAAGTPVTIVYELAEPVTETLAQITPIEATNDTIQITADSTNLSADLTCSGWENVSDTSELTQDVEVMRSTIQQLVDEIALKVAKGDLETYLRLMQEGVYIGKSDSIYRVFIDDAGMHVQQYGEDIAVFAKRTLITPYIRVGPPDSPSGLAISKASDGGMMITNLGVIV